MAKEKDAQRKIKEREKLKNDNSREARMKKKHESAMHALR